MIVGIAIASVMSRMTSPAKIRANRRNARRSTGPRSRAGKAIAARNSRRHGLTLPVLDEPSLAREVVELARRIETETDAPARPTRPPMRSPAGSPRR